MIRPLSSLVKDIIKQQSTQVDAVANLYGSPLVFEQGGSAVGPQGTWRINHLNTYKIFSPDEIISKLASIQLRTAPIVTAKDGILEFPAGDGATMASTVVSLPQAVGFTVEISAPNKQIALFIDENLVRRGTNSLITTINLPAGKTPINVITYGASTTNVSIGIPSDITVAVGNFVPGTPKILDSGAINSNYVDPKTGATGVSISWYNQENVGGWGVYQITTTNFGTIYNLIPIANKYQITTNYSGVAPYDSSVVQVNGITLGTIESASYDDANLSLIVTVNRFQTGDLDPSLIYSGTLGILTFQNLQNIIKASQADVVTFVDTNVKKGSTYSYCVDSYAPGDPTLRSNKSPFMTVTAGDIFPPASIVITGTNMRDKKLTVFYTTPADADYYTTRAILYYQGSGAGPIINQSLVVDAGYPSSSDSVIIDLTSPTIFSGTIYFVTGDVLGNEQYVLSGVAYYFAASGQNFLTTLPPTLSLAQVTSETLFGQGINPRLIGATVMTAAGGTGSLQVQYIIMSGGASWITAPTNPFTAYYPILNRNSFVRARASDLGSSLLSDEFLSVTDFDSTPDVSSAYARYIVSSGVMFVTGTVDDDTKSIKWYIDQGADPGDPLSSAPNIIDNLTSLKTFNFNFVITDGQRKIFKIDPYPDLGGIGTVGNSYREEIVRLPRTTPNTSERTGQGAVSRTNVQVSLSPSPPTAVTFARYKPVTWGTVTSGIANTLTDDLTAMAINAFATNWDIEITKGKGNGQRVQIVSNDKKTFVITPNWTTIPDSSSEYYVAQRYRHHSDRGTVTGATYGSLTDSTKSWIPASTLYPHEFTGKFLHIYSGTGVGQTLEIASGTVTTVYPTTGFKTIPDATSGYAIFGPVTIYRDSSKQIVLDYYSTVLSNSLTEEVQSLIIDNDTIPQIQSGSMTYLDSGTMRVNIVGIDEDTKYWLLYFRKNNWPTIDSGNAYASLDPDYLRFRGSPADRQLTFTATTGWYYGIVIPYDSYNTAGNRVIFSGQIAAGPPPAPAPAITSFSIDRIVVGTNTYNKLWWYHNSTAEKPGGNGTVTVNISFYPESMGPGSTDILATGRFSWQDSEDNNVELNTDDTLNSRPGRGSFVHQIFLNGGKRTGEIGGPGWDIYHYRVDLFNNGALIDSYYANYGDTYSTLL